MVVSDPSWTYENVPSEFIDNVPFEGWVTTIEVSESPSKSVSFPIRVGDPESVIETVAASSTVRVSLTVKGISLTGVILIKKLSEVSHESPTFESPYLSAK